MDISSRYKTINEQLMDAFIEMTDKEIQYLLVNALMDAGITATIIYEEPNPIQKISEDGMHVSYVPNTEIKDLKLDFSEYHNRLWVPCKEKLPKKDGMYFITSNVKGKMEVQYVFFQKNIKTFICNGIPVAWQERPKPYIPKNKQTIN